MSRYVRRIWTRLGAPASGPAGALNLADRVKLRLVACLLYKVVATMESR